MAADERQPLFAAAAPAYDDDAPFDFALVFPNGEASGEAPIYRQQALHAWTSALQAPARELERLTREFHAAWERLAAPGDGEDCLPAPRARALVRELLLCRLRDHCRLQLRLRPSFDGAEIICLIRASPALLQQHAAACEYKLPLRAAVDPGIAFWRARGLEQALSEEDALKRLRALAAQGVLPAEDAQQLPDETAAMLSRRAQVMERAADATIDVSGGARPAYTPFLDHRAYEYLYARQPGTGALFGDADRLFLVDDLIGDAVNVGQLCEHGFVDSMTALFGASDGGALTLADLRERWAGGWRAAPLQQPLDDVQRFFGPKVAVYFAWLGCYTRALIAPAAVGLLAFACQHALPNAYRTIEVSVEASGSGSGSSASVLAAEKVDPFVVLVCVFTSLWSVFYLLYWDRLNRRLAQRWGMEGFEEELKPRPQFDGEPRLSPINNRWELYSSKRIRSAKMAASFVLIALLIALLVCAILFIFRLRDELVYVRHYSWGSNATSFAQAALIQVLGAVFGAVAERLNDWENHRTQIEYEDQLILKTFLFQIFNQYSALLYTAFVKRHTYGCDRVDGGDPIVGEGDCMGELSGLLTSIFVVSFGMNCVELGVPLLKARAAVFLAERRRQRQPTDAMHPVELELKMPEYEDTFGEYAEMVLQYGLVSLFVAALPLAPLLALLLNVVEIRVDAYKLTYCVRRPTPAGAEDIGTWRDFQGLMSWAAVFTNTGIVIFTADAMADFGLAHKVGVCFVCVVTIVCLRQVATSMFPETPEDVRETQKRHAYILDRYVKCAEDTAGRGGADVGQRLDRGGVAPP